MSGAAKVQGWREVAELDDLVKEGVYSQVVKESKVRGTPTMILILIQSPNLNQMKKRE